MVLVSKKRPVLILWCDGDDVIVAVVTSAQPRSNTDIVLEKWRESGLKVPSFYGTFISVRFAGKIPIDSKNWSY